MKTSFLGTFVISWSQTEVDGLKSPPLADLRVGAAWNWSGEAVRVDGPTGILPLGDAQGEAEIRARAAQSVRRLLRAAEANDPPIRPHRSDQPIFDNGFTVTDGRSTWAVTVIDRPNGGRPLLMFNGSIPPREQDLWIVRRLTQTHQTEARGDIMGGVICFTPGTRILTDTGQRPVETLSVGDRIQTKDCGYDEVLWIGQRRLSGARLFAMPHLAPVRLMEGALDRGVPDSGLLVSPDHRVVLRGPKARELFNTDEVLAAARDLVNDRTILFERGLREVTYFHMLLSRHQIVFANGVETESFHPASTALLTMSDGDRNRLFEQMPGIAADPMSYGDHARRVLKQSEAALLQHADRYLAAS